MADSKEIAFQNDILKAMQASGWLVGESKHYDRERALYPEDLVAYVQQTQPQAWEKLAKHYPQGTAEALLNAVTKARGKYGTLWVLRNEVKDLGARVRCCTFRPDHDLNVELLTRYQQNRLRVVPELIYSPHGDSSSPGGRIDLTLFVNGLPVATLELKSEFKQALEAAKWQYMKDRPPVDPQTKKPEPLLSFRSGALVHFAVSQYEVAMTTRLAGTKTFFLPFNRGTRDQGAGNDQPAKGYATAYLWEEVFQPDNWLNILARFIHLEQKWEEDALGRKTKKETMIFPRYHQWDAVRSLLRAANDEGPGQKYLIQHSAGSGKSNSIAWLAHQLSSLHKPDGQKQFDSVIVITDRTVLDSQLQDTIYQFEHAKGVVCRINREEAESSKSDQLAQALITATPIIIVTIQTFPHVLKAVQDNSGLSDRNFAIIADEAHSSQTGSTARKLREVLISEQLEDAEDLSSEDVLNATLAARRASPNISYFAFTATPKAKTLELFGRLPDPGKPKGEDNLPEAFHVYSMRQAIEEGFILDVLQNYTSYSQAWKLAHPDAETEVDSKKAAVKIAKWVRLHPHNISQKVQVIVEHFREHVVSLLGGHAKAMVVTSSRAEAVRYKLGMEKYVAEQGYANVRPMVAFSGEVVDKALSPDGFTESNMNPGLKGREMRAAFNTDDYNVMIVANKFQTGFDQPKLVAMYVDKKLKGVDCIQTLSRLNRTYPGKDSTFILDFVNEPEDVLAEFRVYYRTAELQSASDPNLIYDLQESLVSEGIFWPQEVEAFAQAWFDKKASQDVLTKHCQPARDRFGARYKDVLATIKQINAQLAQVKQNGDEGSVQAAEVALAEAKQTKDVLDTFKRNLASFVRFYEFVSQLVDFDDADLEKLNVYAQHLRPLLAEERFDDELDLTGLTMTHYRLQEKRTQWLNLREEGGEYEGLKGTDSLGGHAPKDQKTEKLAEILERLNDLFAAEGLDDKDVVQVVDSIAAQLSKNEKVVAQVKNNSFEQAMLGDFPGAVDAAVIGSMSGHQKAGGRYLSDKDVAALVRLAVYELIRSASGSDPLRFSSES
ncbi:MAG: type I restriction endonuclease subunit R [Oceanococcus sp.]|nr:MAG: type I restriction endonuclease subunit R [Oceanococcus sp.]